MKTIKFLPLAVFALSSVNVWAQQPHPISPQQEIVERFLNGFNDPEKISESLALLADDYRFQNPMVKLHSKVEFIQLAQEIGKVVTGLELVNTASAGDWVATYYVFKSDLPGLERNLASEWFRVEDGVIMESHLIYDASEWRKVYQQMNE